MNKHGREKVVRKNSWIPTACASLLGSILILAGGPAFADNVYERLKSIGFIYQLGHTPGAGLVAGSQGEFYGTTTAGGLVGGGAGVVYRFIPQNSNYTTLRIFGTVPLDLRSPGPLILGTDGALYGVASGGGLGQGNGGLFKINTNGTGYLELVRFGTNAAGASPQAPLMQGTGGRLFGTTYSGGQSNVGTIFAVNPDGSNYQVLHHFSGGVDDGARPKSGLVKGTDGALYGLTEFGGGTLRADHGTIFRINEDGSGYQVLHKFDSTNGKGPRGQLLPFSGGFLVGNTMYGGGVSRGVVFKIHESGADFSILHEFQGNTTDGAYPGAELRFGTNGMIFGITTSGGSNNVGVVFNIAPDGGGYSVLHHFPGTGFKGVSFSSGLTVGTDGLFYGTRTGGDGEGLGLIFGLQQDGAGFSVLRKFSQYGGDAMGGGGSLLKASDGWIYGAASSGGWMNAGAIFKFQEGGLNYQLIHSFSTNEGAASLTLVEALPGVLFGTADRGGAKNIGTIFRVSTDGSDFRVLHEFAGGAGDGDRPMGGVLLGRDGYLYGTTLNGGQGLGTIFRISTDGEGFELIYTFGPVFAPFCSLVQGSDDMLYGTADYGGAYGRGGVFKVSTNGTDFTVLHSFASDATEGGGFSQAGLLIGPDESLYGITAAGSSGPGSVFRITQDGSSHSVIHLFANSDGWNPVGRLCVGQDGMLYGATQFGGTYSGQGGTLFKCGTDSSEFAVLHSFSFPIGQEGGRPTGGLVQGQDGWLYGMTPLGGEFSSGVIFRVHPTELTNQAPNLAAPLQDQSIYAMQPFSYTFSKDMFFEPDWNQAVTYSASNLPPNVSFDPASRTFQGTPPAGIYDITVVGTDNGLPSPLSGSDVFRLSVLLPDVGVEVTPTNVVVNWPDGLAWYYSLEESSSLAPGVAWTNLGMPGGYIIGKRRYTTLPVKEGQWFYRLRSR